MNQLYRRRNAKFHETLMLSLPFQLIAGALLLAWLPAALTWGAHFWHHPTDSAIAQSTTIATSIAFLATAMAQHHLRRYPGTQVVAFILPTTSIIFMIAVAILMFTRASYSRPVLLTTWGLSLLWFFFYYFVSIRFRKLRIAVVPFGSACELQESYQMEIVPINKPELEHVNIDGIAADLHSDDLNPVWEKFLARCTLQGIPVYHVKQLQESITGKVHIRHMAENEFGSLQPSPLYQFIKRTLDISAILITLPLTIPVMLATALAIRLDSPGPALFVQTRIGQGAREFRIFKFRSMRIDAENKGAQLAQTGDSRITRCGHFIRKTRLDELPQFFNVLRGDMSLIGPRPEQRTFVEKFENEIPFYSYRHVVKPGITGWAQVMQGYASNTEDTRVKLQYDLYYIKHFSMWIDILIVFKTIRTVLTGHGAK